ncbi:MAG: glycine betaine ABC transporter substrate-binding protein [Polyangiales bacterium]
MRARIWLKRIVAVPIAALGVLAVVYLVQMERARSRPAEERSAAHASASGERKAVGRTRAPGRSGPIRIGWTAWTDAEVVTNLVRRILEERMGYEVELVMADIGIQYQGVVNAELDAMLMAWLPITHQSYWTRVSGSVVNLGPIYTRARLGWAVPSYVPRKQLESLEDLQDPEVQKRLNGRIQGIDPGSGLMQASETAMEVYGLDDLELVSSSGAAMTAALDRAIRRERWIVVTAWSPHWMFAEHDLRYLDDPQGVLGGRERVHAIVRHGFYEDYPPDVTEMLTRMYLPLDELEQALLHATRTSVDQAVDRYLEEHPARVDYWVTGELD